MKPFFNMKKKNKKKYFFYRYVGIWNEIWDLNYGPGWSLESFLCTVYSHK